jgi:micrococcal nuclease
MTLTKSAALALLGVVSILAGCTLGSTAPANNVTPTAETTTGDNEATVVRVVDGDTIRVLIDGREEAVRYIGINTPERDEVCYREATDANRALVEGQQVRLVKDRSERDRFDRLLRYVYVGDVFVNALLVQDGWADVARYEPDTREFENFRALEIAAASARRGCHPTGIFDDATYAR